MKIQLVPFLAFCLLGFSCSEKTDSSSNSNEWELVIEDSIQVDYLGTVHGAEFNDGKGIIFNFKENKFIQFDERGKILHEQAYPFDGPDKVFYPMQLKTTTEGKLYGASFVGWLYEFNSDLTFKREIKLPFLTEAKDGGGTRRVLDQWKDQLILYYPGRDGANPYDPFFFRDHFLLEKVDPKTGSAKPMIRIPSTSRYASDKYFERPFLSFGILGDTLYLTLDNEPLIHLYDLADSASFLKTIPFNPSRFEDNGEHSEAYQYISGTTMLDGDIRQFFPTNQGIVVIFEEGIKEDIFVQNDLKDPKNFPLYPTLQNQILKIVQVDGTLSNEIIIPRSIDRILAIESLDEPFYALRDDDFIGEEQEYLTFYKLRLRQK
ncbi:MAG: hypothetical protein Q8S14_01440 [Algoriphagus sp.]|uniref:hypothetical protein n=1 Tax=Algoriphagus sp. TaxID=1872435 RepID=UPI00272F0883|nr:hypothetical protein [Algoriphagus sp.]MDP2041513.1 hypothetical protein [Algoriphagus sp.]MDP3470508.1 hypothetical protein [Algoriphagus sp.]